MAKPKRIFTDAEVEKILQLYQEGKTDKEIASSFGMPLTTYRSILEKNHQELIVTIKKSKQRPNSAVEKSLYEQALKGNIPACIFWLCNRDPEHWKNVQKVDVELPQGIDIIVKSAGKNKVETQAGK